jgi:hypothetical protein
LILKYFPKALGDTGHTFILPYGIVTPLVIITKPWCVS